MENAEREIIEINARCKCLMMEMVQKKRELDSLMSRGVTLLAKAKNLGKDSVKDISETFKEYHQMI